MFQMPAVVLSVLIASTCAALFFVWQGKTLRNFVVYWVAGVLGFLAGQWIAIALGSRILLIGQIHPLEGFLVCVGALFLVKLVRI